MAWCVRPSKPWQRGNSARPASTATNKLGRYPLPFPAAAPVGRFLQYRALRVGATDRTAERRTGQPATHPPVPLGAAEPPARPAGDRHPSRGATAARQLAPPTRSAAQAPGMGAARAAPARPAVDRPPPPLPRPCPATVDQGYPPEDCRRRGHPRRPKPRSRAAAAHSRVSLALL